MYADVKRVSKLSVYVSDLQEKLEDYMKDVHIEDDFICGYWTDKCAQPDDVEIVLDASVKDTEVSDLTVTYIITFKVVNKHDNDELLEEAELERLKDTFAFIEHLKFRYEIRMYQSIYYEDR
jgi:hypothetical protein